MRNLGRIAAITIILCALLMVTLPSFGATKISNKRDFLRAKPRVTQMSPKSRYMMARFGILYNHVTWSIRVMKPLIGNSQIPQDELQMMIARAYFQKGSFEKAIEHYSKISVDSEFWLTAMEEKAWSYLRMGRDDKTRALTTTLLSPVFDQVVDSEVYYMASLNSLRLCDYPRVFKITKQFKNRYKKRVLDLESQQNRKARSELKVVSKNIKRLHLVEAEVIQRIHGAEEPTKNTAKIDTEGLDTLVFPKATDEIWIDEIDNYKVGVNDCPSPQERAL